MNTSPREEKLREAHSKWATDYREKNGVIEIANGTVADYWLAKLHQAELNWLTAQIERGEGMMAKWKKLPDDELEIMLNIFPDWEVQRVAKISTIDDFLTPLIERKKEVEDKLNARK